MSATTIFALATPPGRSGVAVLRVSGPSCDAVLSALLAGGALPTPRQTCVRRIVDPATGEALDEPLIVRFASGASFTGENAFELHLHGGRAVVAAVLRVLSEREGLRMAEPGEFTRRAFDNGRLDLAQIEGLADLIDAETVSQRRAALRQYAGSLGDKCREWSGRLTRGLALLEAMIDFADEEIPDETYAVASQAILSVRDDLAETLTAPAMTERLRSGWRVAILGAPNAGKSTLINALAQRDIAITSDIPGTTRDSIEVSLELDGFPVTLIDTAGIRETEDAVEREGVRRSGFVSKEADLRIGLLAPDAPLSADIDALLAPDDLRIWNKRDQGAADQDVDCEISAKGNAGLTPLIGLLKERLELAEPPSDALWLRERHRLALCDALSALQRYAVLASDGDSRLQAVPEIAAQDVREAYEALGRITGERGVERLLDVIFSEFCLGK